MSDAPKIENSSKAVILDRNRVLLMRYLDQRMGLGIWYSLPGGRQRFGETLTEAVVRECKEEIGADVNPVRLLFMREYVHSRHRLAGTGRDQHKVEFYFLCHLLSTLDAGYVAGDAVADEGQEGFFWCDLSVVETYNIFPTRLRDLARLLETENTQVYWGDTY